MKGVHKMNLAAVRAAAKKYQDLVLHPYGAMLDMDGFEAVCTFVSTYGGSNIYVPSVRTIFKDCIEQDIMNQRDKNIRDIIKVYGFSEKYIRELIRYEI